ncbi:MAG: DNA/RNA non-specific endonuclease [Chlorobi bacterium]|jgi:endonuclease G|nr:DNA/RNA non-specific endonuclease [Chlorobiota bacterium]
MARSRARQFRNPRQIVWSLLVLLATYAVIWWQQQHNGTPIAQSLRDTLTEDTSAFVAERNIGNDNIHLELGMPTDATPNDDVIIRRWQYVLSYNPTTRCPNWVAWNLSAWWYGSARRHRGQFMPDPLLPPQYPAVLHRDYVGSNYDRGHMVRSEERTRSEEDNRATFYTTNILPQTHALNAGPWLRLEEYVERLCKNDRQELYIVAGPIYHDTSRTVIGRGVRVPAECFKIIVVLPKGAGKRSVTTATEVIAVRMPNRPDVSGSWEQYVTSVSDIEQATGYRFFTALPDSVARILKSKGTAIPTL